MLYVSFFIIFFLLAAGILFFRDPGGKRNHPLTRFRTNFHLYFLRVGQAMKILGIIIFVSLCLNTLPDIFESGENVLTGLFLLIFIVGFSFFISAFSAISVAASISFCISLMILICELCFPRDYTLGSPDTIATDWDKIDNAEETE